MKVSRTLIRLVACVFILSCVTSCQDLEKLFSESKEKDTKNITVVNAPPPVVVKIAAQPVTQAKTIVLPKVCPFSNAALPKDVEVYAIDGQAWIAAFEKNKTDPASIAAISINIDTPETSALFLTAKTAALWQINVSKRSKLWGVYVSADETQLIAGIAKPTLLQQHYSSLADACGFYWRPELQIEPLRHYSEQLFGKPYIALPVVTNGIIDIKTISPVVAENTIEAAPTQALSTIPPTSKDKETPAPMTLPEALRASVIRPGTPADIEAFKSRYLSVNQKPVNPDFDSDFKMRPVYVITSDFTYPNDLYGADSVIFILQDGAPYPLGNPGHSQVLDMKSGACMGLTCSRVNGD